MSSPAIKKNVRFSTVVETCGRPEMVTLWVPPEKDPTFQRALKQHRVMTVHQENVGTRADVGVIGYRPGGHSALLVFPKSLTQFENARIVGIKYDLISEPRIPSSEKALPVKPPTRRRKPVAAPEATKQKEEKPIAKSAPALSSFDCEIRCTAQWSFKITIDAASVAEAEERALARAHKSKLSFKNAALKWETTSVTKA